MHIKGKCCFFANVKDRKMLQQAHWYSQDIKILRELGFSVTVSNCFRDIPWGCDMYFSWWASGSILPLIKAFFCRKPIITIAGGHESVVSRDSVSGITFGYLASPWYKRIATRIVLRYSTVVLVVSKYMVDHVKKLGAIDPSVVYNCVDTNTFKPQDVPKSFVSTIFNYDESKVMMKRGEVFLRSIPLVLQTFPEQQFVVIGREGDAYERLLQLVRQLGIEKNIEFRGVVDNLGMPEFLNQSKIFVQISESETFGVAIAEAMSCGTPVVVSRQGPIPEVVGDCGDYVDHNNPESVAFAINALLAQSIEERSKIGLKARDRVIEQFSYEKRKNEIEQIISNL